MKPFVLPLRTRVVVLPGAITFVAIVSISLWFVSAARYRALIDAWLNDRRAAGYVITYESRKLSGFPSNTAMRFINVQWKDPRGIVFRTGELNVAAKPWDFKNFRARIKGDASLAAPLEGERSLVLNGTDIEATVSLNAQDQWREAKLSMQSSTIGLTPRHLFHSGRLSAYVARPEREPQNHHEVGLTVAGEANEIDASSALPLPFGPKAKRFAVRMRVMGSLPDVRSRHSVDAWNESSGIIEFDEFSLTWGVLDLASRGTLGFDDNLQPEGAFAGTVAEPESMIKTLMDHQFIALHDMSMMAPALAEASGSDSREQIFPITVQMGGLFFGPIRIFSLPAIEWPEPPDAAENAHRP